MVPNDMYPSLDKNYPSAKSTETLISHIPLVNLTCEVTLVKDLNVTKHEHT